MPALVRSTVEDGIGVVTLSDPDHRNALSKQLSDDLAAAVEHVTAAGAAVLMLDAEPPSFCSGGDLNGLLSREHGLAQMYAGYEALANSPLPTIAAVAGAAVGAGVNLALACDVVIAGESARFDPRFLDVGIHPGGGHLWRLSKRVGAQGAAALSLFGEALTGREAERHGLAWRCVPDGELREVTLGLARRVAQRSPELVARTKQSLQESLRLSDVESAAALELTAQQWSVEQPYFQARVQQIRERIAKAGNQR